MFDEIFITCAKNIVKLIKDGAGIKGPSILVLDGNGNKCCSNQHKNNEPFHMECSHFLQLLCSQKLQRFTLVS